MRLLGVKKDLDIENDVSESKTSKFAALKLKKFRKEDTDRNKLLYLVKISIY